MITLGQLGIHELAITTMLSSVRCLGDLELPVVACPFGFEDELRWIGGTTATFDGEGTCHVGSGGV